MHLQTVGMDRQITFIALLRGKKIETLALIIRIRMHENAIDTWYVEAFQRDRGVAD